MPIQFTRERIQTSMSYAGVGSRIERNPPVGLITKVAARLAALGFTLQSGAATGTDAAFEAGAGGAKRIFLPWRGYNDSTSELFNLPTFDMAARIAQANHPAWGRLSMGERKLHARNAFQVLGADLNSPVRFVLCWTPDGAEHTTDTSARTGGTGTAIRIASSYGIPVFNMRRPNCLKRLALILPSPKTTSGIEAQAEAKPSPFNRPFPGARP